MILSADQISLFWRLWSQACRTQGWTAADGCPSAQIDAERKRVLRECGFESLTAVDRLDGFTKVKNALLVLASDRTDLAAAREADDVQVNRARTLRWVIRHELLPCLALYEPDAEAYMRSVMADKSRWWKVDRPGCAIALEDLEAGPLEQLRMTLNARLNSKRRAAGDTIHDMRVAAGLKCTCSTCRHTSAAVMPAGPADPENEPF